MNFESSSHHPVRCEIGVYFIPYLPLQHVWLWKGVWSNLSFCVVALYGKFIGRRCTWFVKKLLEEKTEPLSPHSRFLPDAVATPTTRNSIWFLCLHSKPYHMLSFAFSSLFQVSNSLFCFFLLSLGWLHHSLKSFGSFWNLSNSLAAHHTSL